MSYMLGGHGFGFRVMGKLGRAWDGACVSAWIDAWWGLLHPSMYHPMHPCTNTGTTPCTAQLAHHPKPKSKPPAYRTRDYMILLLVKQGWQVVQCLNKSRSET